MLESEMEDLLWMHPDKFFDEPLKPFRRQPQSGVGRADLVFEDRLVRLLGVEVKRGKMMRGAIDQIHDYFGMLKDKYPDRVVEMMVVAQSIPQERKLTLDQYNIEFREISEKRFRDVALEIGYVFQSERGTASLTSGTQERTQPNPIPRESPQSSTKSDGTVNKKDIPLDGFVRFTGNRFLPRRGARGRAWDSLKDGMNVGRWCKIAQQVGNPWCGVGDLEIIINEHHGVVIVDATGLQVCPRMSSAKKWELIPDPTLLAK
jgi:hypothetical protein